MNSKASIGNLCVAVAALAFAGCGGDDNGASSAVPGPQPPAPVAVSGIVSDGPVAGGSLFVFTARGVVAAMAAAAGAEDRRAALAGAAPVLMVARDPNDGDAFTFEVSGDLGGQALFLVFDNTDAEDAEFRDTPPNMESVVILRGFGAQTVNVSPHTTAMAQIVRAELDRDGDGTPIATAAIESALRAAELNVLEALGKDEDGEDLFTSGESPLDTDDAELLHTASGILGLYIRTLAGLDDLDPDDVLAALSADASDGQVDGEIPVDFDLDADTAGRAGGFAAFLKRENDDDYRGHGIGACSQSAVTLRKACAVDVIDDLFEGRGVCAGIADDEERQACREDLADEHQDAHEECHEVFEARLDVCDALDDAPHRPAFGPAFAASFVDPREIGDTVEPNPFFPLIPGSERIYEKTIVEDGETITETLTITVTDEVKLIEGIPCLVVRDLEESSAGSGEDTDDWFAQDVDGNVWYCGEISREVETFDGDDPEEAEIVSVDGSWKAGRDGAKAGMLIPAAPDVGDVIRQELLYGEAEDVIEILAIDATESAPGGSCVGTCLTTRDFSPLEPGNEENKFYAPGIGLIVELDPASGERLELIELTPP
jgi:hypothetical protein